MRTPLPLAVATALALPTAAPAVAQDINTGDPNGAYHSNFCPKLEGELKKARFQPTCKTSQGTIENLKRVAADPRQIGFGQLDILALEGVIDGKAPVTLLRRNDANECLFAVTRNKDVDSYGALAANAAKLRFILPPVESGSFGTFRYLKAIDPDGIGRATAVTHAANTDEAIRQALAADDTVTLFVQFPDPDNPRFKLVTELDGHFVPVIDRAILRPQVAGEKIYFAQETQVANAKWSKAGVSVVTACTPLAVFTGAVERVQGDKAQQDHRDLIATVRAMHSDILLPPESAFTRFLRRSRELSAASAERFLKLSEEAREKAVPLLERAREAAKEIGSKAIEAAKPTLEKAKEMGQEAVEKGREVYDKAKESAKEMIDGKPSVPPPAEPKK